MIDSNGYMFDINYKCDGSKSDCVKLVRDCQRLKNRWEELKTIIISSNSEDVLIDGPNSNPYYTCDQRWGFEEALRWIEEQMKLPEEKHNAV